MYGKLAIGSFVTCIYVQFETILGVTAGEEEQSAIRLCVLVVEVGLRIFLDVFLQTTASCQCADCLGSLDEEIGGLGVIWVWVD